MYRIKEAGRLNRFDKQTFSNESHPQRPRSHATKYSNVSSDIVENDSKKIVTFEGLEEFKGATNGQIEDREATEFSNSKSNDLEVANMEVVNSQNVDGFVLLAEDNTAPATEFSNVQDTGATKNSNSSNSVNIIRCSPNPSTSTPISHENLNKSIQNG